MEENRIGSFIDSIKNGDFRFSKDIVHWKEIKGNGGFLVDFPRFINPKLINFLKDQGIYKLYSHQYEAIEYIHDGRDVLITTKTASGKSLSYNVPIFDLFLKGENISVLYIFPTKALAYDQADKIEDWIKGLSLRIMSGVYDGDTKTFERRLLRGRVDILITNPDMLNYGILPYHKKWKYFFERLLFVVIDELHIYKGVFGSHLANLLCRLERIGRYYQRRFQYILTSATIGNPKEHAMNITGRDVFHINKDGSPSGDKIILFVDGGKGYLNKAGEILLSLLEFGIPSIAFVRSRLNVERLYNLFKGTGFKDRIKPYRSGYLPEDRRKIERKLKEGELLGVISTNALEVGIDIGSLDAAISIGYPGSISSIRQQFGRAGRRHNISIGIFIGSYEPVDKFIIRNPKFVIDSNPENAIIDAKNEYIVEKHIRASDFEVPFMEEERFCDIDPKPYLKKDSYKDYPARYINLRGIGEHIYRILDVSGNKKRLLGFVDIERAKHLLFVGSFYLHFGDVYRVKDVDNYRKIIYIERDNSLLASEVIEDLSVSVKNVIKNQTTSLYSKSLVSVDIIRTIKGIKNVDIISGFSRGIRKVKPIDMGFDTKGVLLEIKGTGDFKVISSIAYILKNIAPIFILADRMDMDSYVLDRDKIIFFDNFKGGIGLSERLYENLSDILFYSYVQAKECSCKSGCPSCIGPQDTREDKIKIISLLKKLGE